LDTEQDGFTKKCHPERRHASLGVGVEGPAVAFAFLTCHPRRGSAVAFAFAFAVAVAVAFAFAVAFAVAVAVAFAVAFAVALSLLLP
jgi:hypothetical protein